MNHIDMLEYLSFTYDAEMLYLISGKSTIIQAIGTLIVL